MEERKPYSVGAMTVGDILDKTFNIYKNNFAAILGFSILIGGIFMAITTFITKALLPEGLMDNPFYELLQNMQGGDFQDLLPDIAAELESGVGTELMSRIFLFQGLMGVMGIINGIFIRPFIQGGIANITYTDLQGKPLNVSQAFKSTWKKFWKLVLTGLSLFLYYIGITIILIIIMIILIIPVVISGTMMMDNPTTGSIAGLVLWMVLGILGMATIALLSHLFVSLAYPVAMAEGNYHFNAIGRSFKLVGKKLWKVLGMNVLIYLLIGIMILILTIISSITSIFTPNPIISNQALGFLITALIMPIVSIAMTILYAEVRKQVEGEEQI